MSVCKYWVRGTLCLSCGSRIKGPAVVVVTKSGRMTTWLGRTSFMSRARARCCWMFRSTTRPGQVRWKARYVFDFTHLVSGAVFCSRCINP